MTYNDRIKWDARYEKDLGNAAPASIVKNYWHLADRGTVLDIACGNGRNSLFLAKKGFTVDAVDISTVATNRLAGKHPGINVFRRDLDTWDIPSGRYDLIVNVRFLDRRLFPAIRQGLKTGGVLIFESFIGPENDPYCLVSNELLRAFGQLRIIYYEERHSDHSQRFNQIAGMVAIKQ